MYPYSPHFHYPVRNYETYTMDMLIQEAFSANISLKSSFRRKISLVSINKYILSQTFKPSAAPLSQLSQICKSRKN